MVARADAARRIVELARFCFRKSDQVLHRFHRQRRMHHEDVRLTVRKRDRREVPKRVVRKLIDEIARDERAAGDEKRIAVGGRSHGHLRREDRGPIVDHELPACPLREPFGEQTRDEVVAASRRRSHDANDFGGIVLGTRPAGGEQQRERGGLQDIHQLFRPHPISLHLQSSPRRTHRHAFTSLPALTVIIVNRDRGPRGLPTLFRNVTPTPCGIDLHQTFAPVHKTTVNLTGPAGGGALCKSNPRRST